MLHRYERIIISAALPPGFRDRYLVKLDVTPRHIYHDSKIVGGFELIESGNVALWIDRKFRDVIDKLREKRIETKLEFHFNPFPWVELEFKEAK